MVRNFNLYTNYFIIQSSMYSVIINGSNPRDKFVLAQDKIFDINGEIYMRLLVVPSKHRYVNVT